ncbi:MAG: hypothetical protein HY644_00680 [Acidobacteria bacterium]|nr:hypothetical protein [Acidobacteriota bacterium]
MGDVITISRSKIYQDKRPIRRAYIASFQEPVRYGVHSDIKEFYKMEPDEEFPSTLDHVVSAVAG